VITLFMSIALGVVTLGYAFLVVNMISHAARDGARLAAAWPDRGTCQVIQNYGAIQAQVNSEIAAIVGGSFQVKVLQVPTPNGTPPCGTPTTPQVRLEVIGCAPYLFPILPSALGRDCNGTLGFQVDRSAYFADQGIQG